MEILLQKMGSSYSDEVRQRALTTFVTKVRCKLVDLDDVCMTNPEISATLLYWMQDFYYSTSLDRALGLLVELTKRPSTLARLRQNSAPTQFLCELREWCVQNNRPQENILLIDQALKSVIDKDTRPASKSVINKDTGPVTYSNMSHHHSFKENQPASMNASEVQEGVPQLIEKPTVSKLDYMMLPQISLLESDEKLTFDIGVQLKFGNYQTLVTTLRDSAPVLMKDFPIEIFKLRWECIESVIGLVQHAEVNVCFYAGCVLLKLINKIHKRIRLVFNTHYRSFYQSPKDEKEYLMNSYPTLDTRYNCLSDENFNDHYIESTISHKTLKSMIEMICVGLLKNECQFPGLRYTTLKKVVSTMEFLVGVAPEATFESIRVILKALAQFMDRYETPVKEPGCNLLVLIAVDLFLLLPAEPQKNMNRVLYHLAQSSFSNVLIGDQSQNLLSRLTMLSETETIVQHGRIEQIIAGLNLHWQQRSTLSTDFMALTDEELLTCIDTLSKVILAIPMIESKPFIKNYLRAAQYAILMNLGVPSIQEALIQVIYAPSVDAQIILYTAIIQALQDVSPLRQSKQKAKDISVRTLTIKFLQNEHIFSHLIQNSLRNPEVYRLMLEIFITMAQIQHLPDACYQFTHIITSYHHWQAKQTELVLTLMSNSNQQSDFSRQVITLFSKDYVARQKATSLITSRSYCQGVLDIRMEGAPQADILQEFVDSEGSPTYTDQIDDSIKSIILRRKSKQPPASQIDVSIEQISNLEGMATQTGVEYQLRAGAVDQICSLYLSFAHDELGFARSAQLKPSQLRQYWQSVVSSIMRVLEQPQLGIKHIQFQAKILDLLYCYLLFANDDEIRQEILLPSLIRSQGLALLIAIQYIRNPQIAKGARYSGLRFLFASTFRELGVNYPSLRCSLNDYIPFCPIGELNQQIPSQIQHWSLYYPLSQNAQWYVTRYLQCIEKGLPSEGLRQSWFELQSPSLPAQIDWVIAMKSLNITIKGPTVSQLKELILNPAFLGSNQMYLLKLIAKLPEHPLHLLLKSITHLFNESEGHEQLEVAALYMQICNSAGLPMTLPCDLTHLFQTYPFNPKAARLTLKLIKKSLLQPSPQLLHVLQQHCLSTNEFQFRQCNLVKLFLSVTLGFDLLEGLQEVDRHILFNQYIQFCQSPNTQIRTLALNSLRNQLSNWTPEQQARIADECISILYTNCEAQIVCSIALQILNESLENQEEVKNILLRRGIFSHLSMLLSLEGTTLLFKSALINLILPLVKFWGKESTHILISSPILATILNILGRSTKALKDEDQINEACLLIHGVTQLYTMLLNSSVALAMQLLQTYNIIDQCSRLLRRMAKVVQHEYQCQTKILEDSTISISQAIQISSLMQGDLVCVDFRKTKGTLYTDLTTLLKNDGFSMKCKLTLTNTITCVLSTGYAEFQESSNDLVCCLNQIYTEALDNEKPMIIKAVGLITSLDNKAKLAAMQTRLPEQIAQLLSRELDLYVYEQPQTKQTKSKSKFQLQPYQSNETILAAVLFLKLLFVNVAQEENWDLVQVSNTIGVTIEALHKLLLVSQKHSQAIEQYKAILINLSTNRLLTNILTQKITENKQQILVDLTKHIRTETLSPEHFETCLSCLSALGQNQEFRLIFYRLKLVEELIERLYRLWEKKKSWNPNSRTAKAITFFLASLSYFKDAQPKILNSLKTMTLFVDLIRDNGLGLQICKDILMILVNCAIKLKGPFLTLDSVPGMIMLLIADDRSKPQTRTQVSQLLLNLLYKSTQAITLFNKPDVIEELQTVMNFAQRQADRYILQQAQLPSEQKQFEELRKVFQELTNNINQILKVLRIEW